MHELVADLAPFAPPEVGSLVTRLSRLAKKPLPSSTPRSRVARSSPTVDPWECLPSLASIVGDIASEATGDGLLHQTLDPLQAPASTTPSPGVGKLAIGLGVLAVVILALVALIRDTH